MIIFCLNNVQQIEQHANNLYVKIELYQQTYMINIVR